jgi:hypothetical protein
MASRLSVAKPCSVVGLCGKSLVLRNRRQPEPLINELKRAPRDC